MTIPFARLQNAVLGYSGAPVLSEVTVEIAAGGFTALVGPNGAGKTTFLRTLLGRLKPLRGRVEVDRSLRSAYVPQIDTLNLHWPLSVSEAVTLALRARRPLGRLDPADERAAEDALALCGLSGVAGQSLRSVSGGQRQRAVLAQALAQNPQALLLDEPTKGLDAAAETAFLDLLKRLKDEKRLTILYVTHALPTALNHASQILLFHQGRVAATTPDALVHTRVLEDIYGVPFVHAEKDGLRFVAPARRVP